MAVVRTASNHVITPEASAPPSTALTPADIQSAYNLPSAGSGQTVAIVDAFGDSTAESDLAVFRAHFGLPPCTTANGCFTKVDQRGGTNYPSDNSGWALETSLDLDAVSSACPACHILLVESDTNNDSDMGTAEEEAATLGAKFISNSWGEDEFSGEQSEDQFFDHPGIAVTFSSGDAGNVQIYPSTDPSVISVGGTRLTRDSSVARGWDESAWDSGGSGCSLYEPQPSYQAAIATECANRATADISADADPASGLAVYDTDGDNGWLQIGGTSLAAPLVASMYALAGAPEPNTYPVNYPYHDPHLSSDVFDVTEGTNGSCGNLLCQAGPGWDGPTGLGSPNGVVALQGAPQGVISGEVTDASTGNPIAGATVSANPGNYATTTDGSGHFTLDVSVGSYDLTASVWTNAGSYAAGSQSGVQVTQGQTTTADFALTPVPSVTVSGTVTDGSGHGWPLYAKIVIPGDPNGPFFSNPFTGRYAVRLPEQASWTLQVSPVDFPGYVGKTLNVAVGTSDLTQDVSLAIDPTVCTAPGYGWNGLSGGFTGWSGSTPQDGWKITGNGPAWSFDNPGNRTPPPNGSGQIAVADSNLNSPDVVNTTLVSPPIDLSQQSSPTLEFDTSYYGVAKGQKANVDLSLDSGNSWIPLWYKTTTNAVGHVTIPIPQAGGHRDVKVRFHYVGRDGWWWAIDNVFVGTHICVPQSGGLVEGIVSDASGQPLVGATVTSSDRAREFGITEATPDDPTLADGYYWLFSSVTGAQQFTASDAGFSSSTSTVTVSPDAVSREDWTLRGSPSSQQQPGTERSRSPNVTAAASLGLGRGPTSSVSASLITGDRISVTPAGAPGSNRYSVSGQAEAAPNWPSSPILVQAVHHPDGSNQLFAVPAEAQSLVRAGRVDKGLFDLGYLISEGLTSARARLPVVVQYSSPATGDVARRAAALPASRLVSALGNGVAEVRVDVRHAEAFWAAITGGHDRTIAALRWPDQLAGGIARIWLAGHRLGPETNPGNPETLPVYRLTETIHARDGAQAEGCLGAPDNVGTICPTLFTYLIGISGPDADQIVFPDSMTCVELTSPCRTLRYTYSVPAGLYHSVAWTIFKLSNRMQWVYFSNPDLRVADDTSISFDANDANQIRITTPQPTEPYDQASFDDQRTLPDGTTYASLIWFLGYGTDNLWATPTAAVTHGTFHVHTNWILGKPLVSASVAGPHPIPLDVTYPGYRPGEANRFSGTQTLALVDAGEGTTQDFQRLDAQGKLALISASAGNCGVTATQLDDARQAGAVGVVFDPSNPAITSGSCYMPTPAYWLFAADQAHNDLPFIEISSQGARTLRELLAHGPVFMTVSDGGESPYSYDITLLQQGRIPDSLNYRLSTRQLATLNAAYASTTSPSEFAEGIADFFPDESIVPGVSDEFLGPVSRQVSIGPVAPDLVYSRFASQFAPGDPSLTPLSGRSTYDLFDTAGDLGTENWNDAPTPPGAVMPNTKVLQAQPGKFEGLGATELCAACRQGNVFVPWMPLTSSDLNQAGFDIADGAQWAGQNPQTVHLYDASGAEIAPTPVLGGSAYTLPANEGRYRLAVDSGGNTQSAWNFSTAAPATDHVPDGSVCIGTLLGSDDPCEPVPLLFLRYGAGVDLSDAVSAPGRHELKVTVYEENPQTPNVTYLKVWTSTDHGATWAKAAIQRRSRGTYEATYRVPNPNAANSTVSIKAEAGDSSGNQISQVITDAFKLTR